MKYTKNISGQLNKIIDIYDYEEIVTDTGASRIEYKFYETVFAMQTQMNYLLNEFYMAMQLQSKEYYVFTIRSNTKVQNKMRIRYKEDYFEIKRIIDEDQLTKLITIKIAEN